MTTDQRTDYYRDIALQLHQLGQHSELCKLALCLGQRHRLKGDRAVLPVIDHIAQLLCEQLDRLPAESLVDFSNGSLEIGWLFHALRLLGVPGAFPFPYEDFNEFLYRRLIFEHGKDISLRKGALGRGIYLLSCYEDDRRAGREDRLRATELHECLVHIVEDLRVLLSQDVYGCTVALFNPANEILHLILFLARTIELKLYPEAARQILKDVLPCVATWLCRDGNNRATGGAGGAGIAGVAGIAGGAGGTGVSGGAEVAGIAGGSRFRCSFESWEFLAFLEDMPARYRLPDPFIGLQAYCSSDRLCERLVSRLQPADFINYLHHEAIKVSGIVRLVGQPLLLSL